MRKKKLMDSRTVGERRKKNGGINKNVEGQNARKWDAEKKTGIRSRTVA